MLNNRFFCNTFLWLWQRGPVGWSTTWPRLKYPNSYLMDHHDIFFKQGLCPEDDSKWLWLSSHISSSAITRLTFVVFEWNISKRILAVHQICTNISAELYMPHSFCLWTNSIKLITSLHLYFLCSNPRFWVHFLYLARDYLCHFRCPNKVVENQVNRLACLHPDWSPDTCVSCCAGHDAMFPGLS